MQKSYYFSHDYGARNDPKLIKLMMVFGPAGKGIFWDLVEMLHEEKGYLLLAECESYAFALRTECDTVMRIISDFGLFQKDDVKFWSESVLRRIELQKEKSVKARGSAMVRWSDANALRTQSEGNALKETKIKRKRERAVTFTPPVLSEVKAFFTDNQFPAALGERAFEYYNESNWKDSNGNPVRNWKQKMRGVWFKDDQKVQPAPVKKMVM